MYRWHITIEAWPHSTGKSAAIDQAAAGERTQSYYIVADDIGSALKFANCIVDGMISNPACWKAPITGITRVKS